LQKIGHNLPMPYARSPIVVVPVGDLHVGSSVALCPAQGVRLEDGGVYMPNDAQRWLWERWADLVGRVRALRRRRYHVVVLWMGEFIDGRHHETTQLLAQSPELQAAAALDVIAPLVALASESYVVRGTEAHSGKGAATDYSIGREIGARRDPSTGMAAWYHLLLDVAGVHFDVAHHVGGGGDDPRLFGGAIRRETAAMLMERPDTHIVLRGHVHRFADTGDAYPTCWGAVVPAWQLKTAFTHRVTRREYFSVGTWLISISKRGEWEKEKLMWSVPMQERIVSSVSTSTGSSPSPTNTRTTSRATTNSPRRGLPRKKAGPTSAR
jgi:hypothetical protein